MLNTFDWKTIAVLALGIGCLASGAFLPVAVAGALAPIGYMLTGGVLGISVPGTIKRTLENREPPAP